MAADSVEHYEALAIDLGLDPGKSAELKRTLRKSNHGNSLFAPQRFCRQLETAYLQMQDRRLRGERRPEMR